MGSKEALLVATASIDLCCKTAWQKLGSALEIYHQNPKGARRIKNRDPAPRGVPFPNF